MGSAAFKEEVNLLCDSKKLKELIERHIPDLIELLTEPLADGLITNAVKPDLKDWQNNKIRTLADLKAPLRSGRSSGSKAIRLSRSSTRMRHLV